MYAHVCGIDNGYHATKYFNGIELGKFNSRIEKADEDIGDVVQINGLRWTIGKGTEDIEINKTKKEVHKILTWAALAQCIKEETAEVNLVLGLPIMHYKNKEFREKFRQYIMNPHLQTVRFNDVRKIIKILDCLVFAQGAAALFADPSMYDTYKKRLNAIVDFGGLTINGFVAEGMTPIYDSMFTINQGTIILFNRIKTMLNQRLSMNIQDYEVPYIISNPIKDTESFIEQAIEQHFENLKKEMRKKNWNIETLNLIGVGGGFELFKNTHYFPKLEILQNPVYANVKGLYKVGEMYYAKETNIIQEGRRGRI